jgi:protein involved in polysaccharide export with SLBB domain
MNKSPGLCLFVCGLVSLVQPGCHAASQIDPMLKIEKPTLDSSKPSKAIGRNLPTGKLFKIETGVSQEYILGPGDVLSVTDTSEDKPTTSLAPILPDGTAVISFTGVVEAAGKSMRDMNELVNSQAKRWYVNPQIVVNLAKQRPTTIYLLGELEHPGFYSSGSDSGMMPHTGGSDKSSGDKGGGDDDSGGEGGGIGLGTSMLTLTGALQMAGGLKETADVRHVRVTRLAPKNTFQVDLWKLMIDGDVSEDIILQPGDVVWVPKGGADFDASNMGRLVNNSPKVRVFGSVKTPGLLNMSPDDDILAVIAKAGGFEPTASTKFIYLARTSRDGTVTTEKIDVKKGFKDGRSQARGKIHPGDIIIVKRSAAKTVAVTIGRYAPNVLSSAMMSIVLTKINKP